MEKKKHPEEKVDFCKSCGELQPCEGSVLSAWSKLITLVNSFAVHSQALREGLPAKEEREVITWSWQPRGALCSISISLPGVARLEMWMSSGVVILIWTHNLTSATQSLLYMCLLNVLWLWENNVRHWQGLAFHTLLATMKTLASADTSSLCTRMMIVLHEAFTPVLLCSCRLCWCISCIICSWLVLSLLLLVFKLAAQFVFQ